MPTHDVKNAKHMNPKREIVRRADVVVIHKGELRNPVSVRWYMGRARSAKIVYCSIWVNTAFDLFASGHGSAGGLGYDKESAALQDAIDSARIVLTGDGGEWTPIDGTGDAAIREALEAITRAAGYRGKMLIV